jgi:pimeloyl-ACP methyl ester carboxylesterase|tara:strand:- start:1032 stop:1847 length:816 start_codon:yes stop_codon:yes gene_type:complete
MEWDVAAIQTKHGFLEYEVMDASSRWRQPSETVLFHHGVGIDMDIWIDWLPYLSTKFRCVRFDMRGCGRSSIPPESDTWSMEEMMSDVLTVADAVDADQFHLIGESIGGTISLYTALNAPDRVTTVTALSTGHRGNYINQVGSWRNTVEQEGFAAWTTKMMEHRFYPGAVADEVYNWFSMTQAKSSPHATLALGELLMAQDLSKDLDKLANPVLLIHPDSSPFLPVSMSAEIHSLLPNSELMVIPHAKHAIACSHAKEASAAFLNFINRCH